jgi:ethanolamine transporter EutH
VGNQIEVQGSIGVTLIGANPTVRLLNLEQFFQRLFR